MISANQEQGILQRRRGDSLTPSELPVGARVRILPNHACATASQHRDYLVVDEGVRVGDQWARINGW